MLVVHYLEYWLWFKVCFLMPNIITTRHVCISPCPGWPSSILQPGTCQALSLQTSATYFRNIIRTDLRQLLQRCVDSPSGSLVMSLAEQRVSFPACLLHCSN